jgi:hypothetical protein
VKEVILYLPDKTSGPLMAEATSACMSLEQWIIEEISIVANPKAAVEEAHMLLAAALDTPGVKCL